MGNDIQCRTVSRDANHEAYKIEQWKYFIELLYQTEMCGEYGIEQHKEKETKINHNA